MTNLQTGILFILHEHKEIRGTETLARLLNTPTNKGRVFSACLSLNRMGMIDMQISDGGRSKPTVYRDRGVIKVQR